MPAIDACWNRIGVRGDRSCADLRQHVHCHNCPVYAAAASALLDRAAPDGYLAEWTGHVARPKAVDEGETRTVLIFRVGGEWLALAMSSIVEVASVRPIHSLPHRRTSVVVGVANVRGELLTCVSLSGLLDLGAPAPVDAGRRGIADRRLIVLRRGSLRVVVPVDHVHGIHRVPAAGLAAAPATVTKSPATHSKRVFAWQGRSVGVLDDESLFLALEKSQA